MKINKAWRYSINDCLTRRVSLFGLIQKVNKKIKADDPFERKLRIENAAQPNSSFLVKQGCLPVPSLIFALVFYFKTLVGRMQKANLSTPIRNQKPPQQCHLIRSLV